MTPFARWQTKSLRTPPLTSYHHHTRPANVFILQDGSETNRHWQSLVKPYLWFVGLKKKKFIGNYCCYCGYFSLLPFVKKKIYYWYYCVLIIMSSHGFLNSMLLVQWVPLLVITRELKKMEESPGCKQMKDLGPFLSQDMMHLPRRFNLRSRARSIFYHPLPLYPHLCTEGYNGSGKKNTIPFIQQQ